MTYKPVRQALAGGRVKKTSRSHQKRKRKAAPPPAATSAALKRLQRPSIERVCSKCFEDENLVGWIEQQDGEPGCDACGKRDAPTADLNELADHMRERLERYYGYAADQLPYDSGEGGYLAPHWDTYDLLADVVGLSLPRDSRGLFFRLCEAISDQMWCEYDWLTLDLDDSLASGWGRFSKVVQHQRRFFFHEFGIDRDDPDQRSPAELLRFIGKLAERQSLIKSLPRGTRIYRARHLDPMPAKVCAKDLGPPPAKYALQSNRMNPAGIPMLYAATHPRTALHEVRGKGAVLGTFEVMRDARILDLSLLPPVPGIFSNSSREDRLGLKFLIEFERSITKPVARDQRVHVDYLPSQVATEFFREFAFASGPIDGIQYRSSLDKSGSNIVLFATVRDIKGWRPARGPWARLVKASPWLRLVDVRLPARRVR